MWAWFLAGFLCLFSINSYSDPNLARLASEGTFKPLGTTNPPESPVAWASFATGLNPAARGLTTS